MLLTISFKAPIPLRAEHPAVFSISTCLNMQGNAKTPKITCTGAPDYLLNTRFAGGKRFPPLNLSV
jgi:hypothetical protein